MEYILITLPGEGFCRYSFDFDQLYKESLEKMKNAQTYKDTYDAICYLLASLKDNHSFFMEPPKNGESIITQLSNKPGTIPFTASVIEGQYGLLVLKSYNSADGEEQHRIADSIYAALNSLQQQQVKGLIIDFTKMEGGTTLPFLSDFSPLIDKDMLIGYKDNKGHRAQIIRYKNGIIYKDGRKRSRLCYLTDYAPFTLSRQPIAIITGKYTASAGEMSLDLTNMAEQKIYHLAIDWIKGKTIGNP
jgi:C-terminal processing protease CtpA/Prc